MQIRLVSYAATGLLLCYFASACGQSVKPKPTSSSASDQNDLGSSPTTSNPASSKKQSSERAINFGHEAKFGVVGSNARTAPITQSTNIKQQQLIQSLQPTNDFKITLSTQQQSQLDQQQQQQLKQQQLQQQQQLLQLQLNQQQQARKQSTQKQQPQQQLEQQQQQQIRLPTNFFNVKPISLSTGAGISQRSGNMNLAMKGSSGNGKIAASSRSSNPIGIKQQSEDVELAQTSDSDSESELDADSETAGESGSESLEQGGQDKTTTTTTDATPATESLTNAESNKISGPLNTLGSMNVIVPTSSPMPNIVFANLATDNNQQRHTGPISASGFGGMIPNFNQFASFPQFGFPISFMPSGGNFNPMSSLVAGQSIDAVARNQDPAVIKSQKKKNQQEIVNDEQSTPKSTKNQKINNNNDGGKTSSRSQAILDIVGDIEGKISDHDGKLDTEVDASEGVTLEIGSVEPKDSLGDQTCPGMMTQLQLNIDGLSSQLTNLCKIVPSLTTLPASKLNSLIQLLYSLKSLLKQITLAIKKLKYYVLDKLLNSLLSQLQVLNAIPQLGALLNGILELVDGLLPLFGNWQELCITFQADEFLSSSARGLGGAAATSYGSAGPVLPPLSYGNGAGANGYGSQVAPSSDYGASPYYPVVSPPIQPLHPIPQKCKSSLVQISLSLKQVLKLLFNLLKLIRLKHGLDPKLLFTVKQLVGILKSVIGQTLLGIQLNNINFILGLIDTLGDKLTNLIGIKHVALLSTDLIGLVKSLLPGLGLLPDLCIELDLLGSS